MPWAPVDTLALERRRAEHRQRKATLAQRLYKTALWKSLRNIVLWEEPECRACRLRGVLRPAEVVDHIEPHHGDRARFFERRNLQPLCKTCHDKKTYGESIGRK
jgi:5-methylcytosine-specific restriction protein A